MERFSAALARDQRCTYLQRAADAARALEAGGPCHRHVVVDEVQDLHPAQWRVLRAAVAERPDDLFIAGDPHQRIYDSRVSLKTLGIKITGRSTRMRKNYRSTQEILRWSVALLAGRPVGELSAAERNETLFDYQSALHGSVPLGFAARTAEEELEALAKQIRAWRAAGVSLGEIGVATRFNKGVDAVVSRLKEETIPVRTLRSESTKNLETVSVGTMHAFKGLEYRCVAVHGALDSALPFPKAVTPAETDRIQYETDPMSERCLLFVACTRAREQLYVSWAGQPSSFLVKAGLARHLWWLLAGARPDRRRPACKQERARLGCAGTSAVCERRRLLLHASAPERSRRRADDEGPTRWAPCAGIVRIRFWRSPSGLSAFRPLSPVSAVLSGFGPRRCPLRPSSLARPVGSFHGSTTNLDVKW
nr:3'-5' exonuclease [Streptomyces sp. YIM 98790]